jgi:ABC-type multidrug transport system ATPase subunit/pSer/pThr/pTyr-binding forkhead associated (FHA) protein
MTRNSSRGVASGHAVLLALGAASLERQYRLVDDTVIGRDATHADIVVSGAAVSRRHCRLSSEPDNGWLVEDLDSTNGVFIDGRRIAEPARLRSGQSIGLGNPEVPEFLFYREDEVGKARERVVDANRPWVVGRSARADVALPGDPAVSLHHAELWPGSHGLELRDCKALNGTFLDGRRVNRARVRPENVVAVGHSRLRFELLADGRLAIHELGSSDTIQVQALHLGRSVRTRLAGPGLKLLDEISLTLEPGCFTGILGPSGAGKTTLLKALNGSSLPSEGLVLFNDAPLHTQFDLFRSSIGYVPQDDIIHVELTVDACLDYIARLRLPPDVDAAQRASIVDTTIETLGLSHVRDTPIERLSGGQRKRVSIAAELITRPGILFLDEPTSGLDPSTEERLMHHFRALASAGRTVLITTHILYNLDLLDRVVILARGRLCFLGRPEQALEFFGRHDPESPAQTIRPTRIFELLEGGLESGQTTGVTDNATLVRIAEQFADWYRESPYFDEHVLEPMSRLGRQLLERGHGPEFVSNRPRKLLPETRGRYFGRKLGVLTARHWRIRLASLRALGVYLMVPVVLALVTLSMTIPEQRSAEQLAELRDRIERAIAAVPGGDALVRNLFPMSGNAEPRAGPEIVFDLQARTVINLPVPLGVLLMFVMMASFSGTLMACMELSGDRSVFRRERMAGLGPAVYVSSRLPFLFVLVLLQCILFLCICLLAPEMRELRLAPALLALVGTAWASCALGLLVSSLDPTPGRLSVLLAVAVVLPQLVLSGALAPDYYAGMAPMTQSIADLLPSRWGFEMLLNAAYDRPGQAHLAWLADFVRDDMGFVFGPGSYVRGVLSIALLTLLYLGLAIWRTAVTSRPE